MSPIKSPVKTDCHRFLYQFLCPILELFDLILQKVLQLYCMEYSQGHSPSQQRKCFISDQVWRILFKIVAKSSLVERQ